MELAEVCRLASAVVEEAEAKAADLLYGPTPATSRGVGVELEDYREYVPGDDFRLIDWRLSSRSVRLDGSMRLMVRERRSERMMRALLVLDASSSMLYRGKLLAGLYSLAILAYMARELRDSVVLAVASGGRVEVYDGCDVWAVVEMLCRRKLAGGEFSYAEVEKLLYTAGRRGVLALVTDVAHEPSSLSRLLRAASALELTPIAVFCVDESERKLPKAGSMLLYDPESGWEVLYSDELRARLRQHLDAVERAVRWSGAAKVEVGGLGEAREKAWALVYSYLVARSRL
ncbi:MAG: hypothetical protein DRN99_06215 [Thermoproteota archaeon]|nr:MAG: hypothetical protein DRN99_06215 [Candidatus Korarchaeota archaeon]